MPEPESQISVSSGVKPLRQGRPRAVPRAIPVPVTCHVDPLARTADRAAPLSRGQGRPRHHEPQLAPGTVGVLSDMGEGWVTA